MIRGHSRSLMRAVSASSWTGTSAGCRSRRRAIMSLEAYRSRLRALELAARKLATSAECSGTSEPELIQIAIHFHPAERTSAREAAAVAQSDTLAALSTKVAREVDLFFIEGDPQLRSLKPDPRYIAFLRKMNLPE